MLKTKNGIRRVDQNRFLVMNGSKICNVCNQVKSLSEFSKHKNRIGGISDECKDCVSKRNKARYSKKGLSSNERLKTLRDRAKKHGVPFDLTAEDMNTVFVRQGGLCYYSKIKMSNEIGSIYIPSVDRKIPASGYTRDNIVLCCDIINRMKYDMSYEVFYDLCKKIVNNKVPFENGLGKRVDEYSMKKNCNGRIA